MITLQQLDEAIDLYERCLKEKWGYKVIESNNMECGVCMFMIYNYQYAMSRDMPPEYRFNVIWNTKLHGATHKEAFAPRIVFLKTLREELIREGYYAI